MYSSDAKEEADKNGNGNGDEENKDEGIGKEDEDDDDEMKSMVKKLQELRPNAVAAPVSNPYEVPAAASEQ